MRTMYEASPWKAAATPVFHSSALGRHTPSRLGDPSGYFSREPFIPTRPFGVPVRMGSLNRTLIFMGDREAKAFVEGVDIARPTCRYDFAGNGDSHELGQSCSKPTAGGGGSAEFGVGDGAEISEGPGIGTIVAAGAVGVGVLFLLGIL